VTSFKVLSTEKPIKTHKLHSEYEYPIPYVELGPFWRRYHITGSSSSIRGLSQK